MLPIEAIAADWKMGPLLILALVLLTGLGGGWLAHRIRVPAITGNIVGGALLGYTVLRDVPAAELMHPISLFAMGLIAVAAGGHFSYRRIHNTLQRILSIAFLEVVFAFAFVLAAAHLMGLSWPVALLLAVMATETAPATTIAIVRENHAKGPFVKTLLGVVSVDVSICIVLFSFARQVVATHYESNGQAGFALAPAIGNTAYQFVGALLIGIVTGYMVSRAVKRFASHDFSAVFIAILLVVGLANALNLSPLLSCLFFGMYLANSTRRAEQQLTALDPLELLLYTLFFTLAGVNLHLEVLPQAGIYCIGYLVARYVGKAIGAVAGAALSGSSKRIWSNIPLAFFPHAGVVIGLVVLLDGDTRIPKEVSTLVGTIILAAVTINEIIGPLVSRYALRRARETNLDRPRLVEFLQEEYILTGLQAEDKWDAIRKLTAFFLRTHPLERSDRERLQQTIIEREKESSTAIGSGAAIPHGRIQHGTGVQGVLGICPGGVDFDAPDGRPVQIIVLIVTPHEHEQQHVQVLSALSQMISDAAIRTRLIAAIDPNDAWEIIEVEEARDFNYFLGDEDERQEEPA